MDEQNTSRVVQFPAPAVTRVNEVQGFEELSDDATNPSYYLRTSGKFTIQRLSIPDVAIVTPKNVFRDQRGEFCETYRYGDISQALNIGLMPVQASMSRSGAFTLRGLHYQIKNPQAKFVHVTQGRIFDVAVDLRRESPTFGKWCGAVLDADKGPLAIYVPPRFAHGHMTFAEGGSILYLCTTYHDPEFDRCIRWNDPTIGIQWPIGPGGSLTISGKDRNAPSLTDAEVF